MKNLTALAESLFGVSAQPSDVKHRVYAAAELGFAFGRQRRWRYAANALLLAARLDPLEQSWAIEIAKCALQLGRSGVKAPSLPLPNERLEGMTSFVVCSITPSKLATLRENLAALVRQPWELVHIPDARSLSEGYNRGLDLAKGELLVLCHDDISILCEDFEAKLRCYLTQFDLIGLAGSTRVSGPAWICAGAPHLWCWVGHLSDDGQQKAMVSGLRGPCIGGAQILDGLFLAGRRSTFDALRFDAVTFDGFHCYDLDFSYRAAKLGLACGICLDLTVFHESNGDFGDQYQHYAKRFCEKFSDVCDFSGGDRRLPGVTLATRSELLTVQQWMASWVSLSDDELLARVRSGASQMSQMGP